jgi:hypothetical protein
MKRQEGIAWKHSATGAEGRCGIAGHRAFLLTPREIGEVWSPRRGRAIPPDNSDWCGSGAWGPGETGTAQWATPALRCVQAEKD